MTGPEGSPPRDEEILLNQTEDGRGRIQVQCEGESGWMTQAGLAELFQTSPQNITQFTVVGPQGHNRRADIVIFVNGLPLGVIKLKNPASTSSSISTQSSSSSFASSTSASTSSSSSSSTTSPSRLAPREAM